MRVVAPFPYDRYECSCVDLVTKSKLSNNTSYMECPRTKERNMKPYKIVCGDCGSDIAYIYATDEKLTDWCDLHYTCIKIKNHWNGCMTVNISPIDGTIGFECSCGNDTRDYRANSTLPPHIIKEIWDKNLQGREFGTKQSKFKAIKL